MGSDDGAHNRDHSKKRKFKKDEDQKAYETGYQAGHQSIKGSHRIINSKPGQEEFLGAEKDSSGGRSGSRPGRAAGSGLCRHAGASGYADRLHRLGSFAFVW